MEGVSFSDKCSVYTDLSSDDSLFEGKGDYQFDIYRKMKEENRWVSYSSLQPHTPQGLHRLESTWI